MCFCVTVQSTEVGGVHGNKWRQPLVASFSVNKMACWCLLSSYSSVFIVFAIMFFMTWLAVSVVWPKHRVLRGKPWWGRWMYCVGCQSKLLYRHKWVSTSRWYGMSRSLYCNYFLIQAPSRPEGSDPVSIQNLGLGVKQRIIGLSLADRQSASSLHCLLYAGREEKALTGYVKSETLDM